MNGDLIYREILKAHLRVIVDYYEAEMKKSDDLPIIVGHEACDAWGREWTQSFADGYCHMAERRSDG